MKINYHPIGVIHSPFKTTEGVPIQPVAASGYKGIVKIFPEYIEGLKDLAGFSHIILLYHFHKSKNYKLSVIPFMDTKPRGLFATRAPKRPNPIGLSTVKLLNISDNILHIENVDIVDGTPLLDIKPYIPKIDIQQAERIGWMEQVKGNFEGKKADKRFR